MKVDVLLGLQWGDEGKGKVVDVIAPDYDIIARFQGGPNAGHTLEFNGHKHVLHTIPSGIFREHILNVIGNGVVIDPMVLHREVTQLESIMGDLRHRLIVSERAHLILPSHRWLDAASEAAKGKDRIGSTLKGIGPTYMDKTGRNGLRIGDIFSSGFDQKYAALRNKHLGLLQRDGMSEDEKAQEQVWMETLETLRRLPVRATEWLINDALLEGKRILAEGAQGAMLDMEFGTYPFVTSSNTHASGACTGLGISPGRIGKVMGIAKAYCTRVGSGPFPTELLDDMGEWIRKQGHEFGSTTGRARRCGWMDLPALRYAIMLNGVSELMVMKSDVLSGLKEVQVCTQYTSSGASTQRLPLDLGTSDVLPHYEKLDGWEQIRDVRHPSQMPPSFRDFISFLEKRTGVPVGICSVGPDRDETILMRA